MLLCTIGKGYSTQGAIKNLWGYLDRFALELDVVSRCYSELLTSDPIPPKPHGTGFRMSSLNSFGITPGNLGLIPS